MADSKRIIRRIAAVSPFGPGAIWEENRESFIAMDISRWPADAGAIVKLDRLAEELQVSGFKAPPRQDPKRPQRLPFYRFPEFLFCPNCRALDRYSFENPRDRQTCLNARCFGAVLVPVRFIAMCAEGHIFDVDWLWWVHRNSQVNCQERHSLIWRELSGGIGLEGLRVECTKCKSSESLKDISHIPLRCAGRHPWEKIEKRRDCHADVLVTQRGNHNVWTPALRTALDIPPESNWEPDDDLREALKENEDYKALVGQQPGGFFEQGRIRAIAGLLKVPAEKVQELIVEGRAGKREQPKVSPLPLRIGEWRAFLKAEAANDKSRFVVEDVNLNAYVNGQTFGDIPAWASQVQQVVAARRLREVRALRGFSRIKEAGESFKNSTVQLVGSSLDPKIDWLPAVEVFGEGLFLRFDEDSICRWEAAPDVVKRIGELSASGLPRLGDVGDSVASMPRLYLLHTIAHLLIQQLIFDAGYPAASMRERLYVSDSKAEEAMCGILIYTASGDSQGSMGGLVRQSEPARFITTFGRVLERGQWCSLDPVCSETRSGEAGVNQAACHACSLVPEVSCELRNLFLDRSLVVGSNYSYFR